MLEQRVHPCMVPNGNPISKVSGSTNAVVADGNFVGTIIQEGAGAGAGPTASAVASDYYRYSPWSSSAYIWSTSKAIAIISNSFNAKS